MKSIILQFAATSVVGAMIVASCSLQQDFQTESPRQSSTLGRPVAYAVADFAEGPVPAAIFNGSFVVARDCLMFRVNGTDYLPVFGSGAVIVVGDETVTVGERSLPLGQRLAIGGGTMERPATLRLRGGPGPCDGLALRVGSIIG